MGARVIAAATLVLTLLAGCYNSFDDESSFSVVAPTPNMTISELHALVGWQSAEISASMIIRGTVTATDESGNFYRSFVIEQEGYAVEILEGLYDSYVRHPVGSEATISLKGLKIARSYGIMQIGLPPDASSDYQLDYITIEPLVDSYITITAGEESISPRSTTITSLTTDMCGTLIEIENLQYNLEDGESAPTWGGDRYFSDSSGESICVTTSDYANFALITMPLTEVNIAGILQYYNGTYIIKMRDVEDCTLL